MKSLGDRILEKIVENSLFSVSHPDPDEVHVFTWNSGAPEQLEAIAIESIEEQRQADGEEINEEITIPHCDDILKKAKDETAAKLTQLEMFVYQFEPINADLSNEFKQQLESLLREYKSKT